ncbi:MAG TPA: Gfo/Idh/MocA family oxidoreductase [Planctomycetota bacterium]|jgi:predicted dehydrogenase|nr:Gfo/Idh/MocA family oxidoreductase [Planctomycetota bacterium]
MALKMIQVGTGGFGGSWCKNFLPPNVKDGLIEVVAAVDVNTAALKNAKDNLGLKDSQLYTDVKKALDENKADFCTVVVPPAFHEGVVDQALAHDLHILSEKPIADTLAGSLRIAEKVKKAGKKMGVTMSHRFDQDKTTLREEIKSGRHGALDYLVCRFTSQNRVFGSWGKFRHEIPDTLLVEGAVHQLDFLADMTGSKCHAMYAQTWTPKWGEYAGDAQALVTMQFENGTRVLYEGANCNAAGLNSWGQDYIRAECEKSTLVLSRRSLEKFPFDAAKSYGTGVEGQGEKIPLLDRPKWSHAWLIEQFAAWLNGGEPMETNVEDNLQSVALVFGGIESSKTGKPVLVQKLLKRKRKSKNET